MVEVDTNVVESGSSSGENPSVRTRIKPGEQAREMGRKGGRARTPRKKISNNVSRRVSCDARCAIFKDCPYMALSMASKEKKKPCGLKMQTRETQSRVWDILRKGDPELKNEMKRVLVKMGSLIETSKSPRDLALYQEQLKNMHELLFGKFIRQEVKADANINVLWDGALRSKKKE